MTTTIATATPESMTKHIRNAKRLRKRIGRADFGVDRDSFIIAIEVAASAVKDWVAASKPRTAYMFVINSYGHIGYTVSMTRPSSFESVGPYIYTIAPDLTVDRI